ncbi:hypothetical protein GCM10009007_03290 [Formosimonas limnophila]|uniref:Uncharacterized protein n=1 Tax=Formosimonas limnophila TaxID=1384487 RepID=A0A8J3CMB6_9BURK|nr:hypothetical protein [Formosimonas limnophila]GHA66174.1 hypothetical protein GCM10009007_03290 [Formosimonas limnophila]
MRNIFEKVAALLFLFMLVGIVLFLVYVPMPAASEKVILMIIGALVAASTGALPKLFGTDKGEEDSLKKRVVALEQHIAVLNAEAKVVKSQYDQIVQMLIERHVVNGDGIVSE